MRVLKVTQVRSVIGSNWRKKRTIQALGLRKIRHSVIKPDTPDIRGMINKVRELVKVEEVEEAKSFFGSDDVKEFQDYQIG